MKLEDIVVSLELAKELKAAGYPQESLFYWVSFDPKGKTDWRGPYLKTDVGFTYAGTHYFDEDDCLGGFVAAPTASELGEKLPKKYCWKSGNETRRETQYTDDGKELVEKKIVGFIECAIYGSDFGGWHYEHDDNDNEANARAKCLLYLKQNNLLGE